MCFKVIFVIVFFGGTRSGATVSDQQYASMPELFHQDNYDKCMLRGNEAFYCSFAFLLEPRDKENPSEMWKIIRNCSRIDTNYDHDNLRHWICVPETCPGVQKSNENDSLLKEAIEKCYNTKFAKLGLKGTISKLSCETNERKYPLNFFDIICGILGVFYILFVLYATYYEGNARYKSPEEYEMLRSTISGKLLYACSITKNWIRLKTIKSTPDVEKLRCIQGVRVYNMSLVVFSHTMLGFLAAPISNTKYPETIHRKNAALFFSNGPLGLGTFFFISSFLLSNGLFEYLKDKKRLSIKVCFIALAYRLSRLTPTVLLVILFHVTWLRHLGSGPNWNNIAGREFHNCRKNGWSNLLYINNWVDPYNMCLPVTWYLGLDTQYFILSLPFIGLIKKYERHVWFIVGGAIILNVIATFLQNYYYNFTAIIMPTAELTYNLQSILGNKQFIYQWCGFVGNMGGPIVGIAFGYYFNKYKNEKLFNTKFRRGMWWVMTFGLGFSYIIITGAIILRESGERNAFWASIYVAVSRPIFTFAIGTGLIGLSEGVGWLALRVCEWGPTYVLGRLTFSAYLIHMSLILTRASLARYPTYITDFQITMAFFGDLSAIYLAAAILTLFVELPVSELQKLVFAPELKKEEKEVKDK